jgi:hypothetical protein
MTKHIATLSGAYIHDSYALSIGEMAAMGPNWFFINKSEVRYNSVTGIPFDMNRTVSFDGMR